MPGGLFSQWLKTTTSEVTLVQVEGKPSSPLQEENEGRLVEFVAI